MNSRGLSSLGIVIALFLFFFAGAALLGALGFIAFTIVPQALQLLGVLGTVILGAFVLWWV